jgi:hypothetical protein
MTFSNDPQAPHKSYHTPKTTATVYLLTMDAQRMQASRQSDIVLGEPKDLTGAVVDEKGQPIPEAEVGIAFAVMGKAEDCRTLAVPSLLHTRTDSNGHFRFANMPAEATFEFLVRKPGRVTLNTFAQALLSDSASLLSMAQIASGAKKCQFSPGQIGIKFTLPLEARVEGMVVEKASGKPAGGVRVTARADQRQAGLLPPDPVATAEDGTFHIGGLAAGNWSVQLATTRGQVAEWVVEPFKPGYVMQMSRKQVSVEAGETKRVEFVLRVTLQASGRERLFGRIEQALTDMNGKFEIKALPAGQQYELIAAASGYGTGRVTVYASHLNDRRQDVGQFRLTSANLSISGIVVDPQEKPVAGATVHVIDRSFPL